MWMCSFLLVLIVLSQMVFVGPLVEWEGVAVGANGEEEVLWWNSSWKERIPIFLNETNGIAQGEFVVDLWLDLSGYNVTNATREARVVFMDPVNETEEERPIQITDERNRGGRSYEARILFQTTHMHANEHQLYHIYLNNTEAEPSTLYTNFNPDLIKNRLLDPTP
ncbi:MAG: hypothetical protein KAT70_07055, partial [Thermoplasmata archaeon]|nr:hypothetical protein [Thermoplasmata archaeon]